MSRVTDGAELLKFNPSNDLDNVYELSSESSSGSSGAPSEDSAVALSKN